MAAATVVPIKITGDERDIVAAWRRAGGEGERALRGVKREAAGFGGVMGGLRRQILGAGSALAGAFAARELVGEALAIEQATVKLRTQLGLTADEAAAVERQSIRLSETYGVAAEASINAGFAIQSAGLRGAAAQEALEAATMGAAIGLGEARDIGLLSAAAMTAWGEETLTATRSTEILGAAVKAGNLEASELTGSLGQALAPASTLGIAFEELAGSVAFYTRYGVGASESTTAVRQSINAMLKPSRQAKTVLDEIGLSAADLQQIVREQGLVAALQFLRRELGDDDEAFARVLGSTEALGFALAVTGEGAGDFAEIMDTMRDSVGSLDEAVDIQVETSGTKLAGAWETVKGLGVDLASSVLPAVADGAKTLVGALRSVDEAKADEAIERTTAALAEFRKEFAEGDYGGGRGIAGLTAVWGELNRELEATPGILGRAGGVVEWFFPILGNLVTTGGEADANTAAFNATLQAGILIARQAGIEVDGTTESWARAKEEVRALGFVTGDYADHIVKALIDLYGEEQVALEESRAEMSQRWASIGDLRNITEAMAEGNVYAAQTTRDLGRDAADAQDPVSGLADLLGLDDTSSLGGAADWAEARVADLTNTLANLNGKASELDLLNARAELFALAGAALAAEAQARGLDSFLAGQEAFDAAAWTSMRIGEIEYAQQQLAEFTGVFTGGNTESPAERRARQRGGGSGGGTTRPPPTTTPTADEVVDWLEGGTPEGRAIDADDRLQRAWGGDEVVDVGLPDDPIAALREGRERAAATEELLRQQIVITEHATDADRDYWQQLFDLRAADGWTLDEINDQLRDGSSIYSPIVAAIERESDAADRRTAEAARQQAALIQSVVRDAGAAGYNALVDAGIIEGNRLAPEVRDVGPTSPVFDFGGGRGVWIGHRFARLDQAGITEVGGDLLAQNTGSAGWQADVLRDIQLAMATLVKEQRRGNDAAEQTAVNTAGGRRSGVLS